jgi:transposase
MKFHGIDIHKDNIVVATITLENGEYSQPIITKHRFDHKSFEQFQSELKKDDYIMVEAMFNTFWFYEKVADKVKECFVLDTNKLDKKDNKTDKIDAKELVNRLVFYIMMGKDRKSLPLVYIPVKEVQNLRSLFTTYKLMRKQSTQIQNRIYSLVNQNGYGALTKPFDFARKSIESGIGFSEAVIFQLRVLFSEFDGKEKVIKKIRNKIEEMGIEVFPEEVKLLTSIIGFSIFLATALMSDVATVKRFENSKKFCSYLRTAPTVKSSNKTRRVGKVNKEARVLTASLLSQSVLYFTSAGPYLSSFYERVSIGKSKGKARMAIMRMILKSAYHVLTKKENFYWTDEKNHKRKLIKIAQIKKRNLKNAAKMSGKAA